MMKALLPGIALVLATTAQADEWIVDLGGLGDTASIQGAVDLASDGDVIVVRPGTYVEDVAIQGKGLWIVAQQGGSLVRLEGGIHLDGIPAGTQVVLRDLAVEPVLPDQVPLRIVGCEALVTLVGCGFRASAGPSFGLPLRSALMLDGASRVNSVDCEWVAAIAFVPGPLGTVPDGDPAILLSNSKLALWGGRVVGAEGIATTMTGPFVPGDGGPGVLAMNSELFLSGADVQGGEGGYDGDFIGVGGGDGGPGLEVDAGSRVFAIDTTALGGAGGTSSVGGPTGAKGAVRVGAGPVYFLRGEDEVHGAGAFAFNQSNFELTLRGRPGANVDVYLTTEIPPFLLDRGAAWTFVSTNAALTNFGPISPAGFVSDTVSIPQLPSSPATLTASFIGHVNRGGRGPVFGPPIPVVGVNCQAFGSDCDGSGRSDLCEIVEGSRPDIDGNGQVDSCDVDCNGNGLPDAFDIQSGGSLDVNGNGVPDECEPAGATWYVSPTALPGGDGSLGAPYRIIAEALASTLDGHVIVLLDGVHRSGGNTGIDLGTRSVTVRSLNGPGACTLDLEGAAVAFRAEGGAPAGPLVIEGIRFVYGQGSGFGASVITTRFRDLEVRDCVFASGAAAASGGALHVRSGNAEVTGCTFLGPGDTSFDNESAVILGSGGGVHIVDDCLFSDHRSVRAGAALDVRSNLAFVTRCRFLGAETLASGGAVTSSADSGRFDQCLFAGNSAGLAGGAMWLISSVATLSNCTFVDNDAPVSGSLQVAAFSDATVTNSIFSGVGTQVGITSFSVNGNNVGSSLSLEHVSLPSPVATDGTPVVIQSMVTTADPIFTLPAGPDGDPATLGDNDYTLGAGSPGVDAGSNALIAPDLADTDGDQNTAEPAPLDLSGSPRRRDDPAVVDTGVGAAPVVDLGCFERQP